MMGTQYPNSPHTSPAPSPPMSHTSHPPNSPSALSTESDFSPAPKIEQNQDKDKRLSTGHGPPVERETGRLNLTRNPSYRPARHPTTPLVSINNRFLALLYLKESSRFTRYNDII